MSAPRSAHRTAPRGATGTAITAGVAAAGGLFAVAMALEVLGFEPGSGEMTDIVAVLEGLLALTPWAWATAGAYVVVATPVIGLLVTAWEYRSVQDQRTVLLASTVLAVLAASVVVALLR